MQISVQEWADLELTKSRLEDNEELIIKSIIVIMRGY